MVSNSSNRSHSSTGTTNEVSESTMVSATNGRLTSTDSTVESLEKPRTISGIDNEVFNDS